MYLRDHCSLSILRDYFRPITNTPSIWQLDGGKDGVWRRKEEACITTESSFTMYYSEATHQLLWLPSQCCPGIPATHVNVRALYDEDLSIKLRWFYSQIAQLSTDKRIRIILNRRTVLHDTLLAFATLTKEDMAKQIRLQFNGEVRIDQRVNCSQESMLEACQENGLLFLLRMYSQQKPKVIRINLLKSDL